jgi:hypothetical protein
LRTMRKIGSEASYGAHDSTNKERTAARTLVQRQCEESETLRKGYAQFATGDSRFEDNMTP